MKTEEKLVFLLGIFLLILSMTSTAYSEVLFQAEKNYGSVWLWVLTALVAAGAVLSLLPKKKRTERKDNDKNDNG